MRQLHVRLSVPVVAHITPLKYVAGQTDADDVARTARALSLSGSDFVLFFDLHESRERANRQLFSMTKQRLGTSMYACVRGKLTAMDLSRIVWCRPVLLHKNEFREVFSEMWLCSKLLHLFFLYPAFGSAPLTSGNGFCTGEKPRVKGHLVS